MFLKNLNNLKNILSPWVAARPEHAVNALARFFQSSGEFLKRNGGVKGTDFGDVGDYVDLFPFDEQPFNIASIILRESGRLLVGKADLETSGLRSSAKIL
jgi:hypothetical protein